jgi:Ca-activated chloride channel family protein
VTVDVLPDPGTNVQAALEGAKNALEAEEGFGARVIVLFTDGEGHEGEPLPVARGLREAGIPVLAVGVGTPAGEPIPVLDANGRHTGYKKDRAGNVVLSKLDETLLRQVASESGGEYHPATLQGHEVGQMLRFLEKLERGELGGSIRRRVEERFQVPVGIAAMFLLLALLVPEARRIDTRLAGYEEGAEKR